MTRAFLALLASGCMHAIGASPAMQCAAQGMALEGVQIGTSSGFAVANNGRWATSSGYAESVSCAQPTTQKQRCEIAAMRAALRVERDYSPTGYNVALFVGYSLFLVPGAVMYFAFDSSRDDVIHAAMDAAAEAGQRCWAKHSDDGDE